MRFHGLVAALMLSVSIGCTSRTWAAIGQGLAAAGGSPSATGLAGGQELLVFGGPGHKTFLGCLSCSAYSSSSMQNEHSSYGSAFSSTSIFNKHSEFGSAYSQYSACAPYASDPPVVVDRAGQYYGRLTINRSRSDAFANSKVLAWLAGVCR